MFEKVHYAKYSCDEKAITVTNFEDDKCTIPLKDSFDQTKTGDKKLGRCSPMTIYNNDVEEKFRFRVSTTLSIKTEEEAAAAAEAAATSRAHILKAALASIILGASSLMS